LPVPATLVGYIAVLLTVVPVVWLLATERGWRFMGRVARKRRWRVRWREAVEVASQEKLAPGRVVVAWRTRYGVALVVALPRGRWLGDYRALAPRLTTALGAQAGVRVRRHHQQPRLAQVRVRHRDPLADVSPIEQLADRTSWSHPIDVGVDEDGRPVRLDLIRAVHVLVGGTPGSGKSTLAHVLVAHLALDPRVSLRLCDGKEGIELADWAPAADAYAHEEPLMLAVLEQAYRDMQRRAAWLREHGLKSYADSKQLAPVVVVYTPSSRSYHWNRVRAAAGLGHMTLYLATRHYFGWYAVNVLQLDPAIVAVQLGHKDGGRLVEHLYGHRTDGCDARRSATRTKRAQEPSRCTRPARTSRRDLPAAHKTAPIYSFAGMMCYLGHVAPPHAGEALAKRQRCGRGPSPGVAGA
jgi:hypothetical protein